MPRSSVDVAPPIKCLRTVPRIRLHCVATAQCLNNLSSVVLSRKSVPCYPSMAILLLPLVLPPFERGQFVIHRDD